MYCPFGAECVEDEDTGRAVCRCVDTCSDVFAPVCGNDGVTYTSDCQLRMAACAQKSRIYVVRHESCGK